MAGYAVWSNVREEAFVELVVGRWSTMKRPSVARQQSNRPKRKHDAGTVDVDSSELNSVEQSLSVNEAPSTSPSASFVSQLDTLRSFLSGSEVAYNEAELSQCLRQSGYNVQRAAERLITGQFKGRCSGSNPSKSFLLKDSRTSPDTTNGGEVLSGHCPKAAASATKNGRASPESASEPTPTKRTDDQSYVAGSMLLCTRWIIGCSTSRNGRMKHNEVMQLSTSQSGPPVVRLRGNSIEGTLPSNIGAILSPLMRSVIKVEEDGLVEPAVENQPLIFVTGQALMDDFGLSIGKDVPIAVR